MAKITTADLGDTYWTTTEDVRDEFNLEIGNQQPDFEKRIKQATRAMQARWAEATGLEPTADNLPADVPDLLQDATAYLAASKAHLAYAKNVSGTNNDDKRHVFLDREADDAFENWKRQADLPPGSEPEGEESETVTGFSGVIGGEDNSPIYRGDD